MDSETIAKLKLKCYKIVLKQNKGLINDKSPETIYKEADDLFAWTCANLL